MQLKAIHKLLLGLVVLVGGNRAHAQDPQWALKMFDKLEQDFGVVPSGADLKYRLKITNKYQQTVHIVGAASSCGCTVAKPAKDTLASGESTHIEITMNTRKLVRLKETVVTVTFDLPLYSQVRIPVKAFVNPDVLINPGAAEFGAITKGTDELRRLTVTYVGRGRSITGAVSKNPNVQARLVESHRDAAAIHYELQVTIKGAAPLGELRDQLTLVTDDPSNPSIPVLVEARIEREFAITPEVVVFGNLTPGERKTLNIVARSKKPFVIEKIESEKTAGVFEVRLPKDAKSVHVLPLTIIAPKEPGNLSEEFTLTISGGPEPVTFKVQAKVIGPAPAQAAAFVPANP